MRTEQSLATAIDAKACASTYAVFSVMFGLLVMLGIAVAIKSPGTWQVAAIPGGMLVAFLLWARAFRLTIAGEVLSYRSLFGGTRSIRLADVETAETKLAPLKYPVTQLIVTPKAATGQPPIIINMKVFSKQDLHRVFDVLGPRLKVRRTSLFATR